MGIDAQNVKEIKHLGENGILAFCAFPSILFGRRRIAGRCLHIVVYGNRVLQQKDGSHGI